MAVPGLPVPSSVSRSHLTTRHRASRSLRSLFSSSPPKAQRRAIASFLVLLVFLLGRWYGIARNSPSLPRFYIEPSTLPAPPSPPPEFVVTPQRKIPPIIHYIFGMTKDFGGKPFSFVQFVAMNSALTNIKPDKVIMWHRYEPTGWWYDKIQEYAANKGIKWESKIAREVDEIL